jgi:hypothetical protein
MSCDRLSRVTVAHSVSQRLLRNRPSNRNRGLRVFTQYSLEPFFCSDIFVVDVRDECVTATKWSPSASDISQDDAAPMCGP